MRRLRSFWRSVVRRSDVERQMADELSFHIESRAADLMSRDGLSRDEAIRRARIEFGSIERYKDEGRASLGLRLIDDLRSDLRFARRALIRNIGFSTAAVAILALGIGANTAVFSVVDALLLGTLPVNDPQDLVAFDTLQRRDSMVANYSGNGQPGPGGTSRRTSFSAVTFERFRDHATTLSHVFAIAPLGPVTVADEDSADTASAQVVSGTYFEGLGVPAALGRTLGRSDDRPDAEPAAVLDHRYWQRRFLGDPAIIGKTIRVNRTAVTVVGITPETFHGTELTDTVDLSLPLALSERLSPTGRPRSISSWWLLLMGRLKPGSTREQVFAELQPIFNESVVASWSARAPETRDPWRSGTPTMRVLSGGQGPNGPSRGARANLTFLFVVTGVVLLIACVNVASLLLVRAANRRQEMTVRLALGASRARLIRQLLSESLVLAAAGAAAGLALASWANDALPRMFEDDVALATAINVRALAFTAGLTTITALVFGVGHAFRATRVGAMPWLKATARTGGQRALMARTLIGVQIAASLVLLVVAGLFVRTLYNYSQVDVGFDVRNLLVFQIDPRSSASASGTVGDAYERVVGAVEALPGVQSATLSAMPVVARSQWTETVQAERAGTAQDVHIQAVRWNFFETLGMPLVAGRSLQATDISGAPRVAVINAAMARQVFEDDAPLGRHFAFVNGPERNIPIQVVGVVRDAKYLAAQRTCSRDLLHAVHPGSAETDDRGSPNRRRCARDDRCRPRRDTHDRSRPAADARAHAGRTDLPDHPRTTTLRRTDRCGWSHRPAAGVYRAVRRGVVRREAAHERNRRAHGTRRAASRRAATRHGTNVMGGDSRDRGGTGDRSPWISPDCHSTVRRPALRHLDDGIGDGDPRVHRRSGGIRTGSPRSAT